MNRRLFVKALGAVLGVTTAAVAAAQLPPSSCSWVTPALSGWDGPVLFSFTTHPGSHLLNGVGWKAEYHGKLYGEVVALKPTYTLDDVVNATSLLTHLADETLVQIIAGQR